MKNVSSLKANDTNSPKTPGGISKSLLTPCRRLGLSRNWRKSGPSPFISPLAGSSTDAVERKNTTSKRKEVSDEQTDTNENEVITEHINHTPSRNIVEPRKKKSKTLMEAINKSQDQNFVEENPTKQVIDENSFNKSELVSTPVRKKSFKSKKHSSPLKRKISEDPGESIAQNNNLQESDVINKKLIDTVQTLAKNTPELVPIIENNCTEKTEIVTPPVRNKSVKSNRRSSPLKPKDKEAIKLSESEEKSTVEPNNIEKATYTIKEKSPNELRKECMVVIQRKIFKKIENANESTNSKNDKPIETIDSDSDDTPLINIQKQNSIISNATVVIDDDDFIEYKTSKAKLPKLLISPKNKVKVQKLVKVKQVKALIDHKPSSHNCFDDNDDDDFDNKKTILIRKTYDKVIKPSKAKSTGSITHRDIDNLRHRIEAKKKLLLAQSLTPDTEELRNLIKKWQKGCQNALIELLDLMRNKMPDKANMEYTEMLQALKIPPSLVGYDSENDCFVSPDDAGIILGQYKDV